MSGKDRIDQTRFFMSEDDEIKLLRDRVDELEKIVSRIHKRQLKHRGSIEVNNLATIVFLGFLLIIIISLRIEFKGVLFAVPVELLLKALELPAIASIATAIATIILKKINPKE